MVSYWGPMVSIVNSLRDKGADGFGRSKKMVERFRVRHLRLLNALNYPLH